MSEFQINSLGKLVFITQPLVEVHGYMEFNDPFGNTWSSFLCYEHQIKILNN